MNSCCQNFFQTFVFSILLSSIERNNTAELQTEKPQQATPKPRSYLRWKIKKRAAFRIPRDCRARLRYCLRLHTGRIKKATAALMSSRRVQGPTPSGRLLMQSLQTAAGRWPVIDLILTRCVSEGLLSKNATNLITHRRFGLRKLIKSKGRQPTVRVAQPGFISL